MENNHTQRVEHLLDALDDLIGHTIGSVVNILEALAELDDDEIKSIQQSSNQIIERLSANIEKNPKFARLQQRMEENKETFIEKLGSNLGSEGSLPIGIVLRQFRTDKTSFEVDEMTKRIKGELDKKNSNPEKG